MLFDIKNNNKTTQNCFIILGVLIINKLLIFLNYGFIFRTSTTILTDELFYSANSSLLLGAFSNPFLICIVIGALLVPFFLDKKYPLLFSWNSFEPYHKWIVFLATFLVAWHLITLPTNFYFGHDRLLDRFALLFLAIGIWRKPLFIPLFCILSFMMYKELNWPLTTYSISVKGSMLDYLLLAIAFFVMRFFVGNISSIYYFFLALVTHVQNYFWPGISKVIAADYNPISWITESNFSYFVNRYYLDGYGRFISSESAQVLLDFFSTNFQFFNTAILLLELSALTVFFNHRLLRTFLIFCILLNSSIFLFSGVFFMDWILFGLLYVFILFKLDWEIPRTFSIIAVVLLIAAPYWSRPHKLGWIDKPIVNVIEFDALLSDGTKVTINDNSFSPYERFFNYDYNFLFLSKLPVKKIESLSELREYYRKVKSPSDFKNWQKKKGSVGFNQQRLEKFELFLNKFVKNRFAPEGNIFHKFLLSTPFHNYTPKPKPYFTGQSESVESVNVRHKQWAIINNEAHQIYNDQVYTISIQ